MAIALCYGKKLPLQLAVKHVKALFYLVFLISRVDFPRSGVDNTKKADQKQEQQNEIGQKVFK